MTELYARLKRVLYIAAAVIALALPLMFLLEDFVRDAIVAPTAYALWLVSVIIDALPDAYLLGFAVTVVVYVAARSLLRESVQPERHGLPHSPSEGGASTWLRKFELVTKGSYSEQRLEHHVGQLLLRVIAYENRCSTREAGELVESGNLDLPPELTDYLEAALTRRLPRAPNIWERLKTFVLGSRRPDVTADGIAAELEPILRFVENELKIRTPEEEKDYE